MQTKITITNSFQTCFIDIEGTIGSPCYTDGKIATYEAFKSKLAKRAVQLFAELRTTVLPVSLPS